MTEAEKVDAALRRLANPSKYHCGVLALLTTPSQCRAFTALAQSTTGVTVARLVAPAHVARQRGTVALATTKRVGLCKYFFELVLKY